MQIINTEAEFKAACMSDGDKVLAILRYMQKEQHDLIMLTDDKVERDKIYYQYKDLGKFIQRIANESFPLTPNFNKED